MVVVVTTSYQRRVAKLQRQQNHYQKQQAHNVNQPAFTNTDTIENLGLVRIVSVWTWIDLDVFNVFFSRLC